MKKIKEEDAHQYGEMQNMSYSMDSEECSGEYATLSVQDD